MYDYIDGYPSELWEGTAGNAITYLCPPAVTYSKRLGLCSKAVIGPAAICLLCF
ncbi:hypothetical protein RchiOBHm_Chr5g0028651 [Rosa chinensis]|uniref:Uncharacterized protein n=1 Tax=Rosa chinensis TaxID=74649 RepID=A0A2P6Q9G2_ROSCH|nr:hypothetical protein RchiOBHm_Chr5g0028651 [Rosa chinensis]